MLAGDSFGFYVTMSDNSKIEAPGYMRWPKNYADVRNSLDSIFVEIFDNK